MPTESVNETPTFKELCNLSYPGMSYIKCNRPTEGSLYFLCFCQHMAICEPGAVAALYAGFCRLRYESTRWTCVLSLVDMSRMAEYMFNRDGVAGAVLQTLSSLID